VKLTLAKSAEKSFHFSTLLPNVQHALQPYKWKDDTLCISWVKKNLLSCIFFQEYFNDYLRRESFFFFFFMRSVKAQILKVKLDRCDSAWMAEVFTAIWLLKYRTCITEHYYNFACNSSSIKRTWSQIYCGSS